MKAIIKNYIPCIYFSAVWFLIENITFVKPITTLNCIIYIAALVLSVISLFIIKKAYYCFLTGLILSVAASIYSIEYLFFYVPVLIIVFAYFIITENNKGKKVYSDSFLDTLIVVSINSVVVVLIYGLIKLFNYPEDHSYYNGFVLGIHSVILTTFLITFLLSGRNKNNKPKNSRVSKGEHTKNNKAIKNINIIALSMYLSQLFAYYSSAYHNDRNFSIIFYPWLIYIMFVVSNKDINYIWFIKKTEEKIEKLIQRGN